MACNTKKMATLGIGTLFLVSYDCGETFERTRGVVAIGASGEQSESVDSTSLDDTARTFIPGLLTPPAKTFQMNHRPELASQRKFAAAGENQDIVTVRVIYPTTPRTVVDMDVALLGHQIDEATIDGKLMSSINAQQSGRARKTYPTYVPVTGITFAAPAIAADIGDSGFVVPTFTPAAPTNSGVTFSTENSAIVTVDYETGEWKAIAAGVASIYAKSDDGQFLAFVTVTVTA